MFYIVLLAVPLAILWMVGRLFLKQRGNFEKRLASHLEKCVSIGILTPEQKISIISLPADDRRSIHISGTTWIAIFSGLFIVAGVSLLIAHNWDQIGPTVRVLSFLALFWAIGEASIRLGSGKIWNTLLKTLWFFMPILGIGLFAQTFQLSGDPVKPYLVWGLLMAPFVLLEKNQFFTWLHLTLLVGIVFAGSFSQGNCISIVSGYGQEPRFFLYPWLTILFLFSLIALDSLICLPKKYRGHFFSLFLFWVLFLQFSNSPFVIKDEGWRFLSCVSASSLSLAFHFIIKSSFKERIMSYVALVGSCYAMTFLWHSDGLATYPSNLFSFYGIAIVCLMTALALVFFILSKEQVVPEKKWNRLFQLLIVSPLVLALFLPMEIGTLGMKFVAVIANFLLFAGALAAMTYGTISGDKNKINFGSMLLLLLLVTRFFDVIGSFTQGAMVFISSGVFLGVVAFSLTKIKGHLLKVMKDGRGVDHA